MNVLRRSIEHSRKGVCHVSAASLRTDSPYVVARAGRFPRRCWSSVWWSASSISLLQAVTQIQEQTLTFIPKIVAMVAAAIVLMPWMSHRLMEYAFDMFSNSHRSLIEKVMLQIALNFIPVYVLVLFRIAGMMIYAPLLGSDANPQARQGSDRLRPGRSRLRRTSPFTQSIPHVILGPGGGNRRRNHLRRWRWE